MSTGQLFLCALTLAAILLVQYAGTAAAAEIMISRHTKLRENLLVKGEGVYPLHRGDAAMTLFLTVSSQESQVLSLSIEAKNCCLVFDEEMDCNTIHVLGGHMGDLYPERLRNLTLLYPTLYPHNLVGYCDVRISTDDGRSTITSLTFNTLLPATRPLPPHLAEYYQPSELKQCKTIDENPLDDCHPYNCFLRYNGHRNFYDMAKRRCRQVPECVTRIESDPDVAYVPENNQCRHLAKDMSVEDIEAQLARDEKSSYGPEQSGFFPHEQPKSMKWDNMVNMMCNHGRKDPDSGFCICDPSWTSEDMNVHDFDPKTTVYHMCTLRIGGEMPTEPGAEISPPIKNDEYAKQYTLLVILCAILAVELVVCVVLLILINLFQALQQERGEDTGHQERRGRRHRRSQEAGVHHSETAAFLVNHSDYDTDESRSGSRGDVDDGRKPNFKQIVEVH